MKKIIFEQSGNILFAILFTYCFIDTIIHSSFQVSSMNFSLHFGFIWIITLVFFLIFGLLRLYYQKVLGKKDGYKTKTAELSFEDEREEQISRNAATITYRFVPYILLMGLLTSFYSNFFIVSPSYIRAVPIFILGVSLVLFFSIYLFNWIRLDKKT